ncbi:MAG: hypothetical protein UR89_C0006G0007 [Candidatus Roizmanbacteria bacterium GW2011_GWA2_35_8]|uniref:Uncharacterized protein n=1 Tax=Candidatus Roizmanbacteria bacterium GW2011_GWA2_35_8 TaxID=1618479 RepID=A0A0G0DER1_9BACT|nr:MAG: hypothetical protein UR89_C0006G0007 [Candidatus Roizmanbacteria bacterium GW2011_GWA2_35_8]
MAEGFCGYRAEDVAAKAVEEHIAKVDPDNRSNLKGVAGPLMAGLIHIQSVRAKKTVEELPACMFTNGACIYPNSSETSCPIAQKIESIRKW